MIGRTVSIASGILLVFGSSAAAQAAAYSIGIRAPAIAADSGRPRVASVEYGDAYATRLRIHRIASYAELPLFGAEYLL